MTTRPMYAVSHARLGTRPATPPRPPIRRASGELERAVLTLLWSAPEPLKPRQVQERLGGGIAPTTVSTTLRRLVGKGLVSRAPLGKAYVYRPLQRVSDHAAVQMLGLLQRGEQPVDVLRCFATQLPADYRAVLLDALTVHG